MNYDRFDCIVIKYQNHPTIAKIQKKYGFIPYFAFHEVSISDVKTIIRELKSDKASSGDISTKILKQCDFSQEALAECINKPNSNASFTDQFKTANIAPVYNGI